MDDTRSVFLGGRSRSCLRQVEDGFAVRFAHLLIIRCLEGSGRRSVEACAHACAERQRHGNEADDGRARDGLRHAEQTADGDREEQDAEPGPQAGECAPGGAAWRRPSRARPSSASLPWRWRSAQAWAQASTDRRPLPSRHLIMRRCANRTAKPSSTWRRHERLRPPRKTERVSSMDPQRAPGTSRLSLYPELVPYRTGRLKVSDLHELYYEECGSPAGKPVVMLHGGPGGGVTPIMRRYHDPRLYRIVLFDQRGCGRSIPHASLEENTTWDLVADIERLREHLGIDRCQVFGGSWGSTLALAYAQTHPDRVSELILRGIFMLRRAELEWFYQEGCSWLFPEAFADYAKATPEDQRGDMIAAYYARPGPEWRGLC